MVPAAAAAAAGSTARANDESVGGAAWAWDGAVPVEEVVRRACPRAAHPAGLVRVLAQDSGPSVNAGWYLLSRSAFATRLLHYWLELFSVYQPCRAWGQHLIQEALLVAMGGSAPHRWPLSLPCTGREFHALPRARESALEDACRLNASRHSPGGATDGGAVESDRHWQELLDYVFDEAAEASDASEASVGSSSRNSSDRRSAGDRDGGRRTSALRLLQRRCARNLARQSVANECGVGGGVSLQGEVGKLNGCFARAKYDWAPNAQANWERAEASLQANSNHVEQAPSRPANGQSPTSGPVGGGAACRSSGYVHCCDGHNQFAHPVCNRGGTRSAHLNGSGGGGVIPVADDGPPQSERWWSAAGAGVVLLAEGDGWVRFNALKFKTHLLWHHGHGRLLEPGCT
jgi:hypothetical protein